MLHPSNYNCSSFQSIFRAEWDAAQDGTQGADHGGNSRLLLLLRAALFKLLLFILVLILRIIRMMMVFSEDYGWS